MVRRFDAPHLGFETTGQRTDKSVLRAAPRLLGLFSVVCLIYAAHVKHAATPMHQTPWYVKAEPTFSDALATVRRLLWEQTIFQQSRSHRRFQKLPPPLRRTPLDIVSRAG